MARKKINVMESIFSEDLPEGEKEAPAKKAPGAPKKAEKRTYNMTFSITPSLHARIKRMAELRNTTANSMLNAVVTDYLMEMEKKYGIMD